MRAYRPELSVNQELIRGSANATLANINPREMVKGYFFMEFGPVEASG
jgi:hypothetical protein